MTPFVTTAGMKELERQVARAGVSYQEMMEQAGQSAARLIRDRWPLEGKRVLVLCGKGNNGGDGFVAARLLAKAGALVTTALVQGDPATPESRTAFARLPPGAAVTRDLDLTVRELAGADLVVDAIFGTGFRGQVPEELEPLFWAARKAGKGGVPIAALDIPSGVEGDTGLYHRCIPATLTVCMGARKPAHLVNWAGEYLGELAVGSIGAHPKVEDAFPGWLAALDLEDFRQSLPGRSHTGHKGTNGRLLLIAGSRQYPGAAVMAASAAVRSGVGYVRLASTSRVCKLVAAHCPEVIDTICRKNSRGGILGDQETVSALLGAAQGADAIAMGCGLEADQDTLAIVRAFLRQEKPLLLDAGALTALALDPNPLALLAEARCPLLLPPPPGEYARLTGTAPEHNPFDKEHTITGKTKITLLRKGWVTGIFQGEKQLWHFGGCDGLAKGGSGDVLTGILGGFLAQGAEPFQAAQAGTWLHGRAAWLCAQQWSCRGMVPSQLADYLGAAFLEAEQEEG